MKIVTSFNGKNTIKMSKKEWMNIGKKAGWMMKKTQIIPAEGFADGGEPYTKDEMNLMEQQDIIKQIMMEQNRPKKIKDLLDLYVKIHPNASGYEINTLWRDIGQISTDEINTYIEKYVKNWGRKQIPSVE